MKLQKEFQQLIDEQMELAKVANRSKDFEGILKHLTLAWDLLPETKTVYDDSYYIVKSMILVALNYQKPGAIVNWIEIFYLCDIERMDGGEREYLHGRIKYALNETQEASKLFKIAFRKSEGRFPKPDEKEYLKLVTQ